MQNIYSNHGLQRISYATCDPATQLLAFLAREPQAPLHLQHCHVFRTSNSQQAEDLNTLIGNAFRVAYAHQIQDERRPGSAMGFQRLSGLTQSRSADSLLSPDTDLGIIADLEPVYETPDFSRSSYLRHSEQTFQRRQRISRRSQDDQEFFSIQLAPMQNQFKSAHQQQPKSKFKPNSLPVLNCLFAALGKNTNDDTILEETPYADFVVPDLFSQINNNAAGPRLASSYTQEDLRSRQQPIYNQQHMYANNHSRNVINKSKSAHVISCEVYSEVADHTETSHLATLRQQRYCDFKLTLSCLLCLTFFIGDPVTGTWTLFDKLWMLPILLSVLVAIAVAMAPQVSVQEMQVQIVRRQLLHRLL